VDYFLYRRQLWTNLVKLLASWRSYRVFFLTMVVIFFNSTSTMVFALSSNSWISMTSAFQFDIILTLVIHVPPSPQHELNAIRCNLFTYYSMACSGACYEMNGVMEYAPYSSGKKYCSGCGIYLLTNLRTCPCCSVRLRTKPKKREN
jgi:hypothetical protein